VNLLLYRWIINPVLRVLLRSPLHRLVSDRVMLITYTGRRTGRQYTTPVFYHEAAGRVWVKVGQPERKRWWRNLRGGGTVTIDLRGRRSTGGARLEESPEGLRVIIEPADV
jgi:hypothetical protein